MNNKELPRGRQTFGLRTGKRETTTTRSRTPIDTYPPAVEIPISNRVIAPTREKELAPPPTPEEIRDANAGKGLSKTENAILGFAKKHPVVTVGSALAAIAGGFAAVEAAQGNIPGVHRSVEAPSHFDKNAVEGVIGDSNILRGVPKEAIQQMPQFDEKGEPLLLVVTPKEGQVSKFRKELRAPGIFPDIIKQAEANNIKDNLDVDNIAANTDIPIPIDGYAFLMTGTMDGKPVPGGVTVEFMTPSNTLDFVNIDANDIRIQPLINAPKISPENSNGRDYTKGLFVKRGDPAFRTLVDGMTISYFRQGGENGTLTTNRRIPGDIVPLTIPHPTTGENKLPAK